MAKAARRTVGKFFARKPPNRYRWRVVAKMPKKTGEKIEDEEALEKVGLYLPSKLALALRVAAAQRRTRISALAEKLLADGLARLENPGREDR